jgi:glycosyltransferase 2 family protein
MELSMVRYLRYLGLVLLVLLILYAGPAKIGRALLSAHPGWLLLGFLLNIPELGIKAFRWQRIVRWQGFSMTYFQAFLAFFGSLFVGFLTPGRLGEMAKAYTVKHEFNTSLSHGLSSVVVDRMFDMYLLLTLGMLGVIRFAVLGTLLSWPVYVGMIVLLLIPLLFLHETFLMFVVGMLGNFPVLCKKRKWMQEKAGQFAQGLRPLGPARIGQCILLTLAGYAVFFLQCYCCSWALGFSVPLVDLLLLMGATNFLSFIPISISGLGTREACLIFFLARVQPPQPESIAVLFGLVIFLVFFVGGGLIGFVCWQWAPMGLRQARKQLM